MAETSVQRLIDLVAFDQNVATLHNRINEAKNAIEHMRHELTLSKETVERASEAVRQARKEVDRQELEMKELDAAHKEKRRRLETATQQREYQSLNKELELLSHRQAQLEDDLLAAWKQLEHAEHDHKTKKEQLAAKEVLTNTAIMHKEEELSSLINELHAYEQQRSEKTARIMPDLLEKYEQMFRTISNPIVPVMHGSCSACFYTVTAADTTALRRRVLVQCRDCFRFLYLPENNVQ